MRKKKINTCFTILCILGLLTNFSCKQKSYFDEYQPTQNSWNRKDIKKFSINQEDTVGLYNMYIQLRSTNDYPYSNIFLIVKSTNPKGKIMIDTLQYEMADANGNMLGDGFTDIKESKLWFKDHYKFPMKGTYLFEIEHAIRSAEKIKAEEKLDGITDVGLKLEKIK